MVSLSDTKARIRTKCSPSHQQNRKLFTIGHPRTRSASDVAKTGQCPLHHVHNADLHPSVGWNETVYSLRVSRPNPLSQLKHQLSLNQKCTAPALQATNDASSKFDDADVYRSLPKSSKSCPSTCSSYAPASSS